MTEERAETTLPVARCDIECDPDCEEHCHAVHHVRWKRDHEPEDCPRLRSLTGDER